MALFILGVFTILGIQSLRRALARRRARALEQALQKHPIVPLPSTGGIR